MSQILDDALLMQNARRMLDWARGRRSRRSLVGIAGIPGAGKSTLAGKLLDAMNRIEPGAAALVAMDGFHLSNAQLDEQHLRDVKGSPQTFDAEGYIQFLLTVQKLDTFPPVPVYDRTLHEPRVPEQTTIMPNTRVIITEGNYLLLETLPWQRIVYILEECWLLDTPMDVARQRLIDRHIAGGRTPEDAQTHHAHCDEPNAQLVLHRSRPATHVVRWSSEC